MPKGAAPKSETPTGKARTGTARTGTGPASTTPRVVPAAKRPEAAPVLPPTTIGELTTRETAPASHRRPNRIFQFIGVFVLVAGAIAGVYVGFGRGDAPTTTDLSLDAPVSLPDDSVDEEKATARALAKAKAEAAAAAEAERARKAAEIAAREQEAASRSQARVTEAPPVPASCNEFSGNRALGCALLLEKGFGLDQMGCLDTLWTHESHWNHLARNSSSGAYGIPQALPANKMAQFGEDYLTNPVPQIRWGLDYIAKRYGSPCGAWNFWTANNWY